MTRSLQRIQTGAAIAVLVAQIFCPQTAMAEGESRKPNVVFFLVDDLGWPDVGCYGSSFYETPAIDRLAKEGVKFDSAYSTCHVCSPSRASILTGKYPARMDLTEWLGGKKERDFEKLHSAKKAHALPEHEITIAETLRSHGYATANYGKAHLRRDPRTYGFDEEITGWVGSFHAPFGGWPGPGGKYDQTLQSKEGDYFTDKLTDAALDFIERKKDQPFFVHLEHFAVHDPIQGRKDLVEKYKKKLAEMPLEEGPDYILEGNPDEPAPSEASLAEMKKYQRPDDFINNRVGWVKQKQDNVEFAGMVGAMDESLARIRAKLEELKLADNTIIIFTSDNGGMSASNRFQKNNNRVQMDQHFSSSMRPLRGGKGWLYEGGIRVPMIVYWPGHTEPGMVTDVPVTGSDFYPTLLEMLDLPLMPEQHQDGISLVPLLKGTPYKGHDAIYWHFPHYSNHGNQSPGGAVRAGQYKLLEYFENGTVQLFDLENDLGEQRDISKEKPETTQKLLKMLQDWRKAVDAKMPQRKTAEDRQRAAESKQRAAADEASRAPSADALMKADVDHSSVRMTNSIKALADRVRGHVNSQPLRFPNQHWVRGAYYAGLMAMYESTSDRAYLDDCMEWGKQVSWGIKEQGGGPYESGAYPLVCGQIWYGCYRANKDQLIMQPTLAFLEDPEVENPVSAPGKWYLENTGHRFVDGLFTAPPLLAMLYQMTGDEKYVDWMDACFWDVHKEIFDHDADLFYRDARSKPRKTKNGKKVLWSRGNGWAFGAVTRILKYLPGEHPSYPKYKSLYIEMAESLAKRQQADGFWRSNLDDSEQYTMKESSGTGFFCYGITWGVNNGILNRERFLPVARKAWTALASIVDEDGVVGWSQPAGGGPGKVAKDDTSKFGTGIFLLAASEMFLLTKSPIASKSLGLRPGPNATVLLNGKRYRGVGVNYFSCFLRTLKDGEDTSYEAGFATLKAKGIPFARFCATGFWPRDMKLYVEDREEYFRRLDGVVHSAEKHGIGLVPSLFWYYACVPDLVGEPMDQWANPNSKTQAWMRQYVREVVTRYRDNPTIWAWELGNEFSLKASLPYAKEHRPKVHHSLGTPDARSERDDLTYEMVGKAFADCATAVRKHDPHRLIFTGDSFPRLSAWHLEQEGSWKHDTKEQFAEMLIKANPEPISGISLHAYQDDDQRFDEAMAVARKLNKPIFVGEFGAPHETPEQSAECRRLLKAIIDHKIPLAALWVFDHPHQKDFNVTADNGRAWQLDLVAEANRKLRTQAVRGQPGGR